MKSGKISELMLNRSVFKLFRHRREEVSKKAVAGMDANIISLKNNEDICITTNPVMLELDDVGKKALYYVGNNIACVGGEFIGVMVNILMPIMSDEKDIKRIMNDLEEECSKLNVEIIGGHTQMTESVNKTLITVTGIGKIDNNKKNEFGDIKKIQPGDEIIMTKWAGMNGASVIAKDSKEKLATRLRKDIITNVEELDDYISIIKEACIAKTNGAMYMHDITQGGVFSGLWELACGIKKGIEVDIKKIPIRQDIIEVCEYHDINPYMLDSRGALLIVVPHGQNIVDKLLAHEIEAQVIGKVCEHNNKIVYNEDEIRYLDSPASDELNKYFQNRG